ncbi:MAG: UDP-glucuronic acid decarboxylase family protein [archaeon]
MKNIRSLVTGGAGFLGSHLCDYLIGEGKRVVCLDNLYTGREENIDHLKSNPRFKWEEHDLTKEIRLEVDEIYNLACPASPIQYQRNPINTRKMGSYAVMHMLGLAKRTKARFLQASTSEVYGNPTIHPQPETYWGNVNPLGPRSCYDEGKRFAEGLVMDYHEEHKLDTKIVRIFNTYGSRMNIDDGRVISNFIVQALKGRPITVYGEGKQTRSFCYVDDLIEGIYRVMQLRPTKDNHMPINLGNPEEKTILEIAETIKEMTGSKSKIVFKGLPQDDPERRCPDITRAKNLIGWQPKTNLRKGLEKTIEWFEKELSTSYRSR